MHPLTDAISTRLVLCPFASFNHCPLICHLTIYVEAKMVIVNVFIGQIESSRFHQEMSLFCIECLDLN